jgi:hypothetical protein
MVRVSILVLAMFLSGSVSLLAQTGAANRSLVGTVSGFRAESAVIEVRPDGGDVVSVSCGSETEFLRVTPGHVDLKTAERISLTDLAVGDRVLVTFAPGSSEARRMVVMSASDLARKREAERQDWTVRGLAGVVNAVAPDAITLKTGSLAGELLATIRVRPNTVFRRYAPNSVLFADAQPSSLAEVRAGDQAWGRGEKSPDGRSVEAEEVVFGTFLIQAGSIIEVDAAGSRITVEELGSKKTLVVRVTADSQIKRMPAFPGLPGRGFGPPAPMDAARPGPRPGAMPDLSQMLKGMPAATLAELRPGERVVVSSTRGASAEQVTAIMLVANADTLIQMAAAQTGGRGAGGSEMPMGLNLGGLMGLGGLDFTGMIP